MVAVPQGKMAAWGIEGLSVWAPSEAEMGSADGCWSHEEIP